MVESCYILYSCDGSFEPIISNFSGLSAYSSSYVRVYISDPLDLIPNTCFYVLSLGEIECDTTQPIFSVTGETCDCQCYCYFIRSANETTDVTYVNCDDEIVVETILEGFTYNICSKVYPQFDTTTQIPLRLTDICQNGQCPPSIPSIKPKNECDVLTIFPMEVECVVQQPTNDKTFDGAAQIAVSGGTPPYTIYWEVGSFAPALTNLGVGEYQATITDYYGDFSITTTCVLTAETLTLSAMCFVVEGVLVGEPVYITAQSQGLKNGKPYYFLQYGVTSLGYVFWDGNTNEWTFCVDLNCQVNPYNTLPTSTFYPTGTTGNWVTVADSPYLIDQSYVGPCNIPEPVVLYTNLCVTLEVRDKGQEIPTIDTINIQFEPSSIINTKPSWTSTTANYTIYWDTSTVPPQWKLTGYTGNLIYNSDPTSPPLSNWLISGQPDLLGISVVVGDCDNSYSVYLSITKNDAPCDQDGSITVFANGGVAPYTYSINGGLTFQISPIFLSLQPGVYNVVAKDSNNVLSQVTQTPIISFPPAVYAVTLTTDYTNNIFSVTAPTLPAGTLLNVDLVMLSYFSYYPANLSPQPQYFNITTVENTYQLPFNNIVVNTVPLTGPCTLNGPIFITQFQRTYQNTLSLSSNQVITGNTTSTIQNSPTGLCQDATGYYQLTITNPQAVNCECCTVVVNNPIPPTPDQSI